jgi:hypothetical protein
MKYILLKYLIENLSTEKILLNKENLKRNFISPNHYDGKKMLKKIEMYKESKYLEETYWASTSGE